MEIVKEITTKDKYAFIFPYSEDMVAFCRLMKEKVGVKNFHFDSGAWRFNNLDYVDIICRNFPETMVRANMHDDLEAWKWEKQHREMQIQKALRLQKAKTSDLFIPGLKRELYPYQKVGVEFVANAGGRAYIADQPGLGKTIQAISYIAYRKLKKSLIICTASTKYSWEKEIKACTKFSPFVVDSSSKLTEKTLLNNDIIIINYDIVKKYLSLLSSFTWDLVVLDEAQYVKNSSAQRTKAVKSIVSKVPRLLCLSGTPMMSRPEELFSSLNMLDPETWSDYYSFTRRYCGGHQGPWGYEAKGATHIDELQERIAPYFIRRTKDEVLPDLPPKTFIDQPVELDKENKKKYELAEDDFVQYLRRIKDKDVDDEYSNKLVMINELRQISSQGKIWAAKELIQGLIDSGQKVLVFSVYNAPLEELKEFFGEEAVMITGKTSAQERKEIVEEFQKEDSKSKIFLGGMLSAGVGITLTAASNVVMLDFSWRPSDHDQAIDRGHRPGQKADNYSIYQLYAKDTFDEDMIELLQKKRELSDVIIDGKEIMRGKKKEGLAEDIIKIYEKKAENLKS